MRAAAAVAVVRVRVERVGAEKELVAYAEMAAVQVAANDGWVGGCGGGGRGRADAVGVFDVEQVGWGGGRRWGLRWEGKLA